MNRKHVISIAMATYNGARYLEGQLDSFAIQRRRPDELVICDDGSSDQTLRIAREFADRVEFPVRIISNPERLGYNRNFAKAIGACSGDFIFVSDQDDEWYREKIDTVLSAFEGDASLLAVTNDQEIVRGDGAGTGVTVLQNVRRLGYADLLYGPGCCTALRRSALRLLDPFPGEDVPYDHWINIIPALLGGRLLIERPLQNYRRHDNNTSGSIFAKERAAALSLAQGNNRAATIAAYEKKVRETDTIIGRLVDRRDEIDALGLGGDYQTGLHTLTAERDGYAARRRCLQQTRLARIPTIVRMLRSGIYTQFQGYKSAVKDLVG
jgi:glycosyltransferase involved in cell wall biosynthesis